MHIPRKSKAAKTDKVQCYEPATMKYLGYFPALTLDEVCSWPGILRSGLLSTNHRFDAGLIVIDLLMLFSKIFFSDWRNE